MSKKILVTGGAGYIGSHAVKLLLEKGMEVLVFDNLERGYEEPIDILKNHFKDGKLELFKGDLRNKEDIKELFEKHKFDGVMHFAAYCLVSESIEEPDKYFENNVCGSLNLFKEMVQSKTNNIVFSSTCATYGESKYLPIDEKHQQNPTQPYGESKLMIEKMLKWFDEAYDLKSVILRYFNVCGASKEGIIGDSKRPSQLLMQNAVRGALGIEEFKFTCPKVDTPDGTPIRDYINVEDLVDAHLSSLEYLAKEKKSDIFNLGTGTGNSVKEIIDKVKEVLGVEFKAEKGETRKGEYAAVYADISKAKKILEWEPKRSIEDSVRSLAKWYEGHPEGYEK